jgi:hypothetical protein
LLNFIQELCGVLYLLCSIASAHNIEVLVVTFISDIKCGRKKFIIFFVNFPCSNIKLIKLTDNSRVLF